MSLFNRTFFRFTLGFVFILIISFSIAIAVSQYDVQAQRADAEQGEKH